MIFDCPYTNKVFNHKNKNKKKTEQTVVKKVVSPKAQEFSNTIDLDVEVFYDFLLFLVIHTIESKEKIIIPE